MSRWSGGKEHDRSGAGEEVYVALCAGCKGSERNEIKSLRPLCDIQVSKSID